MDLFKALRYNLLRKKNFEITKLPLLSTLRMLDQIYLFYLNNSNSKYLLFQKVFLRSNDNVMAIEVVLFFKMAKTKCVSLAQQNYLMFNKQF